MGVFLVPLLLTMTRRLNDGALLLISEVCTTLMGLIAVQWLPLAFLAEWRYRVRRTAHLLRVGMVLEAPTFTEVLLLSEGDQARLQAQQGDALLLRYGGQTVRLGRIWTLRRWTRTDPVPRGVVEEHIAGRLGTALESNQAPA